MDTYALHVCLDHDRDQAALDAKIAEQQAIVDDMNAKIARAEELVKKLGNQYENYLQALAGAPRIIASFGWPLVRA